MAITLTGTGGLFTRLGAEIAGVNEIATALQATLGTRTTTINNQYLAAQQDVIDDLYATRDGARGLMSSWLGSLQGLAIDTLIEMASDDGTGINPKDLLTAIDKLVLQMKATTQSINRPVLSSTVTADTGNVGNGTIIVSLVDGIDGQPTVMVFAETLSAICTADSYRGGGATASR